MGLFNTTMENIDYSEMSQTEISLIEAFLEEGLGSHKPKIDFQASLKDRLTRAKPFDRRKRVAKAWLTSLGCALAGGAIYSLVYVIHRRCHQRI